MKSTKLLLLSILTLLVASFSAFAADDKKMQTLSGEGFILSTNIDVDKKAEEATKKYAALDIVDQMTGNATGKAGFELTYFGDNFDTKQAGGHAFCSGCHELANASFVAKDVNGKTYCNGCHGNTVTPGAHTHAMPAANGNVFFNHQYSHNDQTFARLKAKLGLSQDLPTCVLCHVGAGHVPVKYGNEPTNIGVEEGKIQLLVLSNPKAIARLKAVKCVETIKGATKDERDVYHLIIDAKQCKK